MDTVWMHSYIFIRLSEKRYKGHKIRYVDMKSN